MELYSEREWERVESLTNVEGVCLKTGYYSWKRELLVTVFGRQSRVPCPVNHFWVCEKYRWSQRGGGGAALAWEAMGLAASSWLSLVQRAARSATCCAMIWASGIGAALPAGGGCWALLNTDEEAAAVLLDDGVVREEGGSAGGGPERPRAAAPGGAADGGGAREGPAC